MPFAEGLHLHFILAVYVWGGGGAVSREPLSGSDLQCLTRIPGNTWPHVCLCHVPHWASHTCMKLAPEVANHLTVPLLSEKQPFFPPLGRYKQPLWWYVLWPRNGKCYGVNREGQIPPYRQSPGQDAPNKLQILVRRRIFFVNEINLVLMAALCQNNKQKD